MKEKLCTKLFQKRERDSSKFTVACEQRRRDVRTLEILKRKVKNFNLGVHSEIELIASGDNMAFLMFSASPEKCYSEYAGAYHPVKLLLAPTGSYEVRVNILDCAERGKVELENDEPLNELICKIASNSQFKICPGLANGVKYHDLPTKLGYEPKNLFSKSWPWKIVRHSRCLIWHIPSNSRLSSDQIEQGL